MAVSSLDFLPLMLVYLKLKEPTAWTRDKQDFVCIPILN